MKSRKAGKENGSARKKACKKGFRPYIVLVYSSTHLGVPGYAPVVLETME